MPVTCHTCCRRWMFTSVCLIAAFNINIIYSHHFLFSSHCSTVIFVSPLVFCLAQPASTCTSQTPAAHFNLSPFPRYHRNDHMSSHHVNGKTYPQQPLPSRYELIRQGQDCSVPLPPLLIAALRQLLKWDREIR